MNSLLHWHRLPGVTDHWRLDRIELHAGALIRIAVAVIKYTRGCWHAQLPDWQGQGPQVSIIRCRSLHEAADCARRWAEYRGFRVAGQFPEGGGHE